MSKKTTLKLIVDFSMTVLLLLLMAYSLLGEEVHEWLGLPIVGGQETARLVHLLCSYWSVLLMSLHLGLHINMISGILRRMSAAKLPDRCALVFRIIAAFVVVYGVIGFFRQDILSYLLLRTHFVFIDFDRPLLLFFADYFAIMGLFVFLGFCGGQMAVRLSVRHRSTKVKDNSLKRRQNHE